MGLQKMIVEA